MAKFNYIAFIPLTLAIFSVFPDTYGHTIEKKSVLPWLNHEQKPKIEVPGYKPILEVHKYNGVQINPVGGGAPLLYDVRTSPNGEEFSSGSDLQIVNLLYRAVPYLPEVERMHEINFGFFGPYLQTIPLASIDKLRVTFESEGEGRVGLGGKAKLLKLLQIIKEMKLKPFKALYNKKKDVLHSFLNYINSPSTPQPTPVHPRPPSPPSPPSPSEIIVVPASPGFFASPNPNFFNFELPYPVAYQASSQPQLSTFYNNVPSGVLPFPQKVLDTSNFDGHYFQTLASNSLPMPVTPLVESSSFAASPRLPDTLHVTESYSPFSPDLLTSASENVEKASVPSKPVEEKTHVISASENVEKVSAPSKPAEEKTHVMKVPTVTTSTTQSTPQPQEYTESSSDSSSLSMTTTSP